MGEPSSVDGMSRSYVERTTFGAIPRHRGSSRARRNRLRLLYFGLASLWGFLVGVAALICGMKQTGSPISSGLPLSGMLLAAGLVALVGGFLAAMIYKDAAKRGLR